MESEVARVMVSDVGYGSVPRSAEEMIEVNGVRLCAQTFGEATDPAIVLIGGAASSMDWWEDEFCERLAAGRRFVIRYDHRDTGRSVSYQAGAPPYTGKDLAADAAGLLDAFRVAPAHLVGVSMGGGIAQCIALEHADRVATLTLVSTSPATPTGVELPPMSDRLRAVFTNPAPEPDWSDRAAVIEYIVAGQRPFAGSHPSEQRRLRDLAGRIFDRTTNIAASMTNHWILDEGDPIRLSLRDLAVPTLVLHGTEDPLFPYGHGEALAAAIPGACLIGLDKVGHEVPPHPVWDTVIPAILHHTAGR